MEPPPRHGRFVRPFRRTGGRRRRCHPSELSKGSAAGRDEGASSDVESDAATTYDGNCDDAEVELLEAESVRKKIEVLAAMVGMEGSKGAGAVLSEVVKVLRELEKKAEHVHWRS